MYPGGLGFSARTVLVFLLQLGKAYNRITADR